MKIAVSGASGLVGRALCEHLAQDGHEIWPLVRRKNGPERSIYWNPAAGEIEHEALEGMDGVVHLAGENIASGRWTAAQKQRIWDSRVEGTRLLVRVLNKLKSRPKVLVSASALGYYGDRGDEALREDSRPDDSFISRLCQEWEAAAGVAEESGIRVVCVRIGLVVSKDGGALQKMLLPFKLGLGGVVGSGRQYIPWIMLEDLVHVFQFAIERPEIRGAINAAAPNPVTNQEWTKALGRALNRPTLFPLPAFVVRAAMGEMGEALLLSSTRMIPGRLIDAGFQFRYPVLKAALAHELDVSDLGE